MTDDELAHWLMAAPTPALRPVDTAAILATASARPAPNGWRWATAAVATLAAGLAVVAFRPTPTPPDIHADRLAALEADVQRLHADAHARELARLAKHDELRDLLLVVAADVRKLETDDRLAAQVNRLIAQLRELQKDQAAMYTLVTATRTGGTP
jgi:hypothetical protein